MKDLPVPVDHVVEATDNATSRTFGEIVNVPKGARNQEPRSHGFQTKVTCETTAQKLHLSQ